MAAEIKPSVRLKSFFPDTAASGYEISPEAYLDFQDFLARMCGIRLGSNKRDFVANRLVGVCENAGIHSVDILIAKLTGGKLNRSFVAKIIDAVTTIETSWFRDVAQFNELREVVLPELSKNRFLTPRIWSAGCSSGEEPYSIAITIEEYNRKNPRKVLKNVQITGTDISESILARAKNARFSEFEMMRGLEAERRSRYFKRCHGGWMLDPKIASKVRFQTFNLKKSFSVLGRFEVIFCRNVLIYFPDRQRREILSRMAAILKPGGYLFLGHSETIPVNHGLFKEIDGRSVRYFRKA